MRIATADPPARRTQALRRADPRQRRYARLEFLGLLVVSAVVGTGFWMTYQRQVSTFAGISRDLTTGALVQPGATAPAVVAEKLTMFPSAAERRFAAEAIDQYVRDNGPLTHVGALAGRDRPGA